MKWLDEWCSAPPAAPCWDGVKMATELIRAQLTDAHESSALVRPSPLQFSIERNYGAGVTPSRLELKYNLRSWSFYSYIRSNSALAEGTYGKCTHLP